ISHAIKKYVRLGFDIETGQDIENAIQGIRGTSVSNLQPNRDRGSGSNTLPGNSNWFEWQWPIDGEFEGCILARSIPNISDWTVFTQTQLNKLQKSAHYLILDKHIEDIILDNKEPVQSEKTATFVTTQTSVAPNITNSKLKLPNFSSIFATAINIFRTLKNLHPSTKINRGNKCNKANRLSKENLVKQLHSRCVEINGKENKYELVEKLESNLMMNTHTIEVFPDMTNIKTQL
ncbi:8141_t:CDS:2, partial [Scutellospora calospora]